MFGRGLNTRTVADLARKPHNSVSLRIFLLIFELLPLRWLLSVCGRVSLFVGLLNRLVGFYQHSVFLGGNGVLVDVHSQLLWGFLFLALDP